MEVDAQDTHRKRVLCLVTINEIQLFVQYGVSGFCEEFAMLSTTLFCDIKKQ